MGTGGIDGRTGRLQGKGHRDNRAAECYMHMALCITRQWCGIEFPKQLKHWRDGSGGWHGKQG